MREDLRNIAIIGGSFGGLVTAIALQKKGFKVKVYEGTSENTEPSLGIIILPNAGKILKKLGLFEEIQRKASRINQIVINNDHGKTLQQTSLENNYTPALGIHPDDLRQILYHALPEEIIFSNKNFVSYQNENNSVKAAFADGSEIETQMLIGADGTYSKVREQLKKLWKTYLSWLPFLAWRGKFQ